MKAKRLLSVVLAAMVVISCFAAVSFTASADESYNTYAKYQESIKAENNYGLTDTVNEGKILQAWNWSYENAIEMMPLVAEQGFTTMQISPPNEIKMATKGVKVCEPPATVLAPNGKNVTVAPNGWWMFYQPAGFQLNESEDNALGTKDEFIAMCAEAKKYGIKILVDAVINHMGTDDDHIGFYNNDSVDPMDHVNSRASQFEPELLAEKAFHSPWKDMTYVENMGQAMRQYDATGKPIAKTDSKGNIIYNAQGYPEYQTGGKATEKDIEESLTQHCTSGLPDLKTETQLVQDTIYDYLKELIDAGADGFRFDAAKHIETVHDTYFPSDFWEDTLQKLRAENPDKEIFAYGEILNKCGDGRPFSEYTELMDVTDSSSFWGIKDAVCNNGNGGNATPKYPNANFTKENVIQWNESHDTYIDGGTSSFTVMQRNKIWALTAARQEITGVYFARPDDRTGTNRAAIEKICYDIELGDANVTSWANAEVAAVNQFDNFFGSAEEFCRTKDKVTLIERFDRDALVAGATLVNLSGTTKSVTVTTRNLPNGTYIEAITGNEFTVANGTLTGQIGSTGIAVLYYAEDAQPEFPVIDTSEVTMDQLYVGMEKWDASNGAYPVVPGANTIVFSAQSSWSEAYVYAWISGTEENLGSWPGNKMTFALKNEYGENQFYTMIPEEYDCYIINNGKGAQTVDLSVTESTGMYMSTMSGGKYTIGTWAPNFEELTVSEFLGTTPSVPETSAPTDPPVPAGILGDADGNEKVNVKDATAIQKHVADIEVTNFNAAVADVDANNKVNVKDATAIQKHVAGIDTGFAIGEPIA